MVNTEIRLIIFFVPEDGKALYSQQKQDLELTVAQIMNSLPNSDLKNVGKTTGPFRYALNQIPFDYVVEVMDRLKGLVPEELSMEVCNIVQEVVTKTIPRKRNAGRLSGCLRRPSK